MTIGATVVIYTTVGTFDLFLGFLQLHFKVPVVSQMYLKLPLTDI